MEATLTIRDLIGRLGGPAKVGALLHVDRVTPYRWRSGERLPSHANRIAMLDACGASADERLAILSLGHGAPTEATKTRQDAPAFPSVVAA